MFILGSWAYIYSHGLSVGRREKLRAFYSLSFHASLRRKNGYSETEIFKNLKKVVNEPAPFSVFGNVRQI